MGRSALFCFLALLLVAATATGAEVYRYTDEGGNRHFVDDPAKVPPRYRSRMESDEGLPTLQVIDPRQGATESPAPARPEAREERKGVTATGSVELFVTSWCGYCRKLERALTEQGVPFVARDIERDDAARQRYEALGVRGVPVSLVNGQLIIGYNPSGVLRALARN